jgi:hypothetical protein
MESLALFSFGFSWITKAEMVFGDGNKNKGFHLSLSALALERKQRNA